MIFWAPDSVEIGLRKNGLESSLISIVHPDHPAAQRPCQAPAVDIYVFFQLKYFTTPVSPLNFP
jgi:hypothetical protein